MAAARDGYNDTAMMSTARTLSSSAVGNTPTHLQSKYSHPHLQYFWHTRAAIGQAAAHAVVLWVQVSEHTLRRHIVCTNVHDNLTFPATVPAGV